MNKRISTRPSDIDSYYYDRECYSQRITLENTTKLLNFDHEEQIEKLCEHIDHVLRLKSDATWYKHGDPIQYHVSASSLKEVRKTVRTIEDICDDPPLMLDRRLSIFQDLKKMSMLGPEEQGKQQLAEFIIRELLVKIANKEGKAGDLYSALRLVIVALELNPRDYKETNPEGKK